MHQKDFRGKAGFTLIEMLMVILLVAILAAVAIPQFIDFRVEARDAATQAALGAVRTAIANQAAQMKIRCNAAPGVFPALASLNANNVVTGGDCAIGEVTVAAERQFVPSPSLPVNPWGAAQSNTVTTSAEDPHVPDEDCAGVAFVPGAGDGWCYNPTTGQFWANSNNSTHVSASKEDTY